MRKRLLNDYDVMNVAAKIIVSGRVQGVGFRWFVFKEAQQVKVSGQVHNRSDGSVEIVVEGDKQAIERLLSRVHHGPAFSYVTDVQTTWQVYTGSYKEFNIV